MRVELHFDADGCWELALVAAVVAAGILLLLSSSVGLLDCGACIPSCVRLATEAAFRPEPPPSSTAGVAKVKRTRCGTCLACVLSIPTCVLFAAVAALRPSGGRAVADPGDCVKKKKKVIGGAKPWHSSQLIGGFKRGFSYSCSCTRPASCDVWR